MKGSTRKYVDRKCLRLPASLYRVRLSNECPKCDTKPCDGEAPVMKL